MSGCPADWNAALVARPGRVAHQPAEEQRVEHALLEPVDGDRELVQVCRARRRRRAVSPDCEAPPVGRAEDDVVLGRHRLDVAGGDLGARAEQSVAVQRDPRRVRRRRAARDDALEQRRRDVAGDLRRRRVGFAARVVEAGRRRRPAGDQITGDLIRPVDDRDLGVRRVRLRAGDRERRRVALRDPVREVRVAELRERVVADREQPSGEVLGRGDREVPRLVQRLVELDLGLLQQLEDLRVALAVGSARRAAACGRRGASRTSSAP